MSNRAILTFTGIATIHGWITTFALKLQLLPLQCTESTNKLIIPMQSTTTPQKNYVIIDTQELRRHYAPRQRSDEYWTEDGWTRRDLAFGPIFSCDTVYRREITWTRGSDKLPTGPVWYFRERGEGRTSDTFYSTDGSQIPNPENIFWLPSSVPHRPCPEMSEEEQAFAAWVKEKRQTNADLSLLHEAFMAGRESK